MVRTRIAPSPTGFMHVGVFRTGLYTYLFTRNKGGKFILRIEDTDKKREVEGAYENILRAFRLAGIEFDEGPEQGGPYGPYIQSERRDTYRKYALELVERGAAYPCFCTEEQLEEKKLRAQAEGETYKYDGACRSIPRDEAQSRIAAGEPHVIRQRVEAGREAGFADMIFGDISVSTDTLDDMVLLKTDGLPTYNFANVVDDHLMEITHVSRGTEYLSSAPRYNLLYEAFGWEPPLYMHMPPIMKDAHRKLSKRHGDPSFEDLLNMGYLPEAIINYVALLGWNPGTNQEFFTLGELCEAFDIANVSKSPSIFDMKKLTWFNAEYIRKLPFEEYKERASEQITSAVPGLSEEKLNYLLELLQPRTEVFVGLGDTVRFLGELPEHDPALYVHKKMKTDAHMSLAAIEAAMPALSAAEWTPEGITHALEAARDAAELKTGQLFYPVRVALSNTASTPGGAVEIAYILGKDETLRRLELAKSELAG